MNPSTTFHVTVNKRQDFEFRRAEVESLDLVKNQDDSYHLIHNGRSYRIRILVLDASTAEMKIEINGKRYSLSVETPLAHKIKSLGLDAEDAVNGESVKAPMPGKVLKLFVAEGEAVESGQDLMILEAMKMENVIKAGANGVVDTISIKEGDNVEKNASLLNISGQD